MTQFDLFTVETKQAQNTQKLLSLKKTLQKISSRRSQLEVKSIERVNKVFLFSVSIEHTNEYFLKLGSDYWAKVKDNTAIEIIQERIKRIQEENKRWERMRQKLQKERDSEKQKQNREQWGEGEGIGVGKGRMQAIGENQEGEQVFNIVQFQEDFQANKFDTGNQKLQVIKEKDQQHAQQKQQVKQKEKQKTNLKNQPVIVQQPIKQKQQQQNLQQKPKKISKFKADRLKQKEPKQ